MNREFGDFLMPAFWFMDWTVCDFGFWFVLCTIPWIYFCIWIRPYYRCEPDYGVSVTNKRLFYDRNGWPIADLLGYTIGLYSLRDSMSLVNTSAGACLQLVKSDICYVAILGNQRCRETGITRASLYRVLLNLKIN